MTLRRSSIPRVPATLPLIPSQNDEGYEQYAIFDESAGNATTQNLLNITGFQFALNAKLISIRATLGIAVTATRVPEDFGGRGVFELYTTAPVGPLLPFSPIQAPSPTAVTGGFTNGPLRNAWWNNGYYRGILNWDVNYGPEGVAIAGGRNVVVQWNLWTPVAVPALDTISIQAEFVFKRQS